MKKYIIITPNITNMGGAQMYVYNKLSKMQNCGWAVNLFSCNDGEVYISELKKYNILVPELQLPYYLFSRKKREAIVQSLVDYILDAEYDDIVIESTCISQSTWAEVIAERCNACHISYLLQENNNAYSHILQDFFRFKLQRHELAGIVPQSISNMFASFSPISLEESSKCYLPAVCTNVVEDVECEWINAIKVKNYDFLVGCLSRLDKPFIMPALNSFIEYSKIHMNKRFLLVMLGGSPENSNIVKNIQNLFRGISNVELLITGYLFPVSTRLLALFDVFFTSAGSARVCARSGIPTITIDGNDFKPIGVLGRTTTHTLFRGENEPPQNFKLLMDDILFNGKYVKCNPQYVFVKPNYSSHDVFLQNVMSGNRRYFSFVNCKLDYFDKKRSLVLAIIGSTLYFRFRKMKKMIRTLKIFRL